jgi:hypothetical protein
MKMRRVYFVDLETKSMESGLKRKVDLSSHYKKDIKKPGSTQFFS